MGDLDVRELVRRAEATADAAAWQAAGRALARHARWDEAAAALLRARDLGASVDEDLDALVAPIDRPSVSITPCDGQFGWWLRPVWSRDGTAVTALAGRAGARVERRLVRWARGDASPAPLRVAGEVECFAIDAAGSRALISTTTTDGSRRRVVSVVDLETGATASLGAQPGAVYDLAWSGDSEHAFVLVDGDALLAYRVAEGAGAKPRLDLRGRLVALGAGGACVAVRDGDAVKLLLYDALSRKPRAVANADELFEGTEVALGQKRIAFGPTRFTVRAAGHRALITGASATGEALVLVGADGTRLVAERGPALPLGGRFALSESGRLLADCSTLLARTTTPGRTRVVVADLVTGAMHSLELEGVAQNLAWSPSGRRLVVLLHERGIAEISFDEERPLTAG